MVVIKINEIPNGGQSALKVRAERAWKISIEKLIGQTKAIVMYKGCILEEYKIISYSQDLLEPDRIAFNFSIIPNSLFKGLKVNYPTSYPCTITNKLTIPV